MGSRSRSALLAGGCAAALILSVGSVARAQENFPPLLPVGPQGQPPPTPQVPPPPFTANIPEFSGSGSPFTAPLPFAVPLPPPIKIPAGSPVPEGEPRAAPWDIPRTIPEWPGRPAPLRLPERADEVQSPDGGLRQAVSEYDRRFGMGSGGAVVREIRETTMSETVLGQATLEIIVDRTGVIRSARPVDWSSDLSGWRRVAERVQADGAPNLRLPEQARGAWMLVTVSADNELTSGRQNFWSMGATLSFDVAQVNGRRVRQIHSHILSEVWF